MYSYLLDLFALVHGFYLCIRLLGDIPDLLCYLCQVRPNDIWLSAKQIVPLLQSILPIFPFTQRRLFSEHITRLEPMASA